MEITTCKTKGCENRAYWGKLCYKHYKEEFNKNKKGVIERYPLR